MTKRYGEFEVTIKKQEKKVSCGYQKCHNGYVRYMDTDYVCQACTQLNKKAIQKDSAMKSFIENFNANFF